MRSGLAHAFSRLLDLLADALNAVHRGLLKLRYGLTDAFSRLLDLLADAQNAAHGGLSRLRSGLAHAFAFRRRRRPGRRTAFRAAPPTVSLRARRLVPAWRPSLPRMKVLVGTALVVAASAGALWLVAPWSPSEERSTPELPRPDSPRAGETETSSPAPGMTEPSRAWNSPSDVVVYVNRRGAYRFSYPSGWSLTERGTAAAVTSPRGTGVVTVGTIERGTIEQAADLFVARIASVYEDVEILRREMSGSGTLPMVGTATDATGDQRRFAATVVDGREGDFVVGAFTPVGDPSLEAAAREILRSFRLLSDDGRVQE